MGLQQFITSTQFYLFGRSHFTATGWARAAKKYGPEVEEADLSGKVYAVTGANSGVGYETARYLASKGGKVYMICRNKERADQAVERMGEVKGELRVIVGDVSSAKSTVVAAAQLKEDKLDALVCNAGALYNDKTMTPENVEVTFASHLAFGSFLLEKRLRPLLLKAEQPRVVFVTSGGMYNGKFPGVKACVDPADYDGQFAYVHAKRGQVLLAEALAGTSKITYVTSHPGWVDTPAVDTAYGDQKKYLQPMRTIWQGAEGQIWLCIVDSDKLQPGGLYLDRAPQRKHLAGPFFTDGSATKNSDDERAAMITDLDALCDASLAQAA